MTRIWYASYFLSTLFTFSNPFQVGPISVLISWRIESGVLDEGDSAGLLQDSLENHFRDMFLNVTHMTCMHSFKAALITFLVTSWLNRPRHCMLVVYFVLWYELIQATAHAEFWPLPDYYPPSIGRFRVRCGGGVSIRGGFRIKQSGSDFNEGG